MKSKQIEGIEKIKISVILVHYHVKSEILSCINSILTSGVKTRFEIIVVDNDEKKTLHKDLKKKYPDVIYIPNTNLGYGHGNNLGAKRATGDYLFILNPDTAFINNVIDLLVAYLEKHSNTAIAAPLLYHEKNKPFQKQGSKAFTPLTALASFSIISKIFPKNSIKQRFWLQEWTKESVKEVDVVPGTAFVIKRKLFDKIGGFDERFFLYFEEVDLCRRIRNHGLKIVMLPAAKIFHAWGSSTGNSSLNTKNIFISSRRKYFQKHYNLILGSIVEGFMRINKYTVLLLGILVLSALSSFYQLDQYMNFIGDQGWYYLAARDMVQQGDIPLVGIPSSHPWLHQGAFWTYILAPVLLVFNYNPLSGAYISIFFHLLLIILLFGLISRMFTERIGILAAALYAVSPLALVFARTPYHTTPIPLLSLLFFYSIYLWVKGKPSGFVYSIWLLSVLYNFQVATFLLTFMFLLVLLYGILKKTQWLSKILNIKILGLATLGFIVIMFPMLLYDIEHGFPQTALFLAWIGYKILLVFGYPPLSQEEAIVSYTTVISFLATSYQKLIYAASPYVSFCIALFSFSFLVVKLVKQVKQRKNSLEYILLTMILVIGVIGIIVTRTPSDAYLPTLYPFVVLVTAVFFDKLMSLHKGVKIVIIAVVMIIMFLNIFTLVDKTYFMQPNVGFKDRITAAKTIVSDANGSKYNLIGTGEAGQHESFTMNYEYLTWWLGNGPSNENEKLLFLIGESSQGIKITKKNQND